jgi:hypothetical protein
VKSNISLEPSAGALQYGCIPGQISWPPEFELLLALIRSVAIEVVPSGRISRHGPGDWIYVEQTVR